jgi:Spy/CpxP family protein refolding chaperone
MKTKFRQAATLILVAIFFLSFSVYAQNEGSKAFKEIKTEKGQAKFDESLKLTEDQKSKMADLRLALKKELLPLKNQLGEKQARMRTLETADKPDMGDINKLIDEIATIKANMAKKQAAHKQDIRKLLTDKQRIIFDDNHGKMPKNMKKKERQMMLHQQQGQGPKMQRMERQMEFKEMNE